MDNITAADTNFSRKSGIMAIALLAMTWAAMSACLNNGFINWDETAYLIRNPLVRSLSFENIKAIFSSADLHLYTPLSTLSYAVEYHFAGLNPKVYHATNLALHMASTILVFALAWRLLARFASRGLTSLSDNARLLTAFGAALFFGIHPAHVESVAWVAERKDMLYGFFFLLSLLLYLSRREGEKLLYAFSLAAFALSLLSKPMAVTLPGILLAYEFLLSGRLSLKAIWRVLPYAVLSGLSLLPILLSPGIGPAVGVTERLTVPLYNVGYYAGLLLFPVNLSAMHTGVSRAAALLTAIAVAASLVLLLRFRRHDRLLMTALCLYIVPLLPVIQIIPFGQFVSADRYTYIASIGFFLLLALPTAEKLRDVSSGIRMGAAILAVFTVMLLAAGARARCAVWFNGVTLWEDTLAKNPRATMARSYLCSAYINSGNPEKAVPCAEESLRINGPSAGDYFNMGFALASLGRAGAEAHMRKALELEPCHNMALLTLGEISFRSGDKGKSETYFRRAAKCGTDSPLPYFRLAEFAAERGETASSAEYRAIALRLAPGAVPPSRQGERP